MSEEESIVSNGDYPKNVALSYEYTEKSIKEVQDSINNTSTQLGLLIGFNFTFVRFFLSELPNTVIDNSCLFCNYLILLKYSAYGFAIVSIVISLFGLYQTIEFAIINPDALCDRCNKVSHDKLQLGILYLWQNKLNKLQELASTKKTRFNFSIACLIFSGLIAMIEEIIVSFVN